MDRLELKKIGILGGTFDPPHLAHLRIAEEVREAYQLEKVFFIPAGAPPHKLIARNGLLKTDHLTPFKERLKMVKLAIQDNPFFEVLDIERKIIPSYTLKTLQKLKERWKGEFFLIIGWDSFCEFETWWNYEKILIYSNIIVVPRGAISWKRAEEYFYKKVEKLWNKDFAFNKVFLFKTKTFDLSSTLIRKLCKEGKSIRYLVPDKVYFYIQKKGFYR